MASLPTTQTILSLQILFLLIASVHQGSGGVAEARKQREFDYFALALQWPGTYCQKTRQCCSSNACCRGSNAPTEFTIHGLWPDYNDGTWPACCTHSEFDMGKVSPLLDGLNKYWPSLSCGSSSTCHEKHGTCSFPVIRDEYEYFLTTLNVYFKYNVTKVLNEAGYVPSNSEKYPLGGVISAIQNAFHATPLLVCSNGAVEELRLCFYKDFKPRDCVIGSSIKDDMLYSKSSCPKYVSLPEFVSLGHESSEAPFSWLPQNEAF
ncbi:Ribonuclease [Actinidia chinensis var. chinensis]|uniref:Ribonuclease n=1 Tax=Actinidia chinensis var. chinensis TaxID=1590841 RepID=A0A2R6PPJ2_ACTCC|nr:Ribonuclease [Actinidia chinensis var. chinensis]